MTAATELLVPSYAQGHLRKLDVRRDLQAVADLVELCFADTLDMEGRRYLQQMRAAANSSQLLSWSNTLNEYSPHPMSGFVWEEDGEIIGNLSLIPFNSKGERCYLIANVAVSPLQRGRGIARVLTVAALDHARNHRVASTWLQVRHDNPSAIHIYQTLGFQERLRRTTWRSTGDVRNIVPPPGYVVQPRRTSCWHRQHQWIQEIYPPQFSWHLSLDRNALPPGLRGMLYRFFTMKYPRHWTVQQDDRLFGALTYLHAGTYGENLWLAAPPDADGHAIQALIIHARKQINQRSPLILNYPAGHLVQDIEAAGFYQQQTLIWMSYRFN
jgi:ribosomal protein S18 acetylase RimI-like enzyme